MAEEIRYTGLRNQVNDTMLTLNSRYILDEKGVPLRLKTLEELKAEEKEALNKIKEEAKEAERLMKEEKKKENRRLKRLEASERLNRCLKATFPATEEGANQLMAWEDEEGLGFRQAAFIIRTMEGNGELQVYEDIEPEKVDNTAEEKDKFRNILKVDYKIVNDCKYFDTRPITFANWLALPMKRKIASFTGKSNKKLESQPDIIGKHD